MLILATGTRHATIADHGLIVRDTILKAADADSLDVHTTRPRPHEVYVGDARGVDLIVRQIFHTLPGWTVHEFEARWEECAANCPEGTPDRPHRRTRERSRDVYCPAAGMRRNREMVRAFVGAGGTTVLAFPAGNVKSRGTRGCLIEAKRAGLVVPAEQIMPLTVEVWRRG